MPAPFSAPAAGVLIPVFSLRRAHDFGIGDTLAFREAIDFCAAHGIQVLQTLPIHDTVGDHSPYNPVSSRALSPVLLALEEEHVPGLTAAILQEQASEGWLVQLREGPVKHRLVEALKLKILLAAHESFTTDPDEALAEDFRRFQEAEADWLPGYTLFRLLAAEYDNNPHWELWRPEHHAPVAAENWLMECTDRERLGRLREGLAFIQWVAHRQWRAVRAHADEKQVLLMGEMSFGVSKSSADVWCRPELFDVQWSMGTLPVAYFDTNKDSERWGQNWGLPPYRWENHRSEDYAWLRARIRGEARYFHVCRLDHLRGYFRAYMFPWEGGVQHAEFATLTAEEARERTGGRMPRFVPGPDDEETSSQMNALQGREIISVMQDAAGDMRLFAEIMGQMPGYMRQAIDDLEMPNLTFPLLEKDEEGRIQSADSFRRLSLVSYGNHDHAPVAAVYQQLRLKAMDGDASAERGFQNFLQFANWQDTPPETFSDELLEALQHALLATPCILAVLMITDLLGTNQRFNLPGSYGDQTWCERLEFPLKTMEQHPVYGPRIQTVARLIQETGRGASASRPGTSGNTSNRDILS